MPEPGARPRAGHRCHARHLPGDPELLLTGFQEIGGGEDPGALAKSTTARYGRRYSVADEQQLPEFDQPVDCQVPPAFQRSGFGVIDSVMQKP